MTLRERLKQYFSQISLDCWAVCLYILFLPGTIVETPVGSLLKAVTYPVIAILIYKLFFGKCKLIRFNGIQLLYMLYTMLTLWGLFLLRTETAITVTKDTVLACAAIVLMSIRVYNKTERDLMEKTWIVVGIVSLYIGFFSTEEIIGQGRVAVMILGNIEDPNQFCGYFIVPIMIYLKRILNKSKLTPVYVVILLLTFYAVLKTGSRGGLIGILIGIAVFVILGIKSIKGKIALLIISLMCGLFTVKVVFPLLPQDVQERYSVQSVEADKGSGRFVLWKYLLEYTTETPQRLIIGEGITSTVQTFENAGLGYGARYAHNQFIQVFADQGLIGLIIYTLFAVWCFFRTIRKSPEYSCAFAAVMAMSLSLTLYVFKPYINIIIMCAMTFEDKDEERRNLLNDNTIAH